MQQKTIKKVEAGDFYLCLSCSCVWNEDEWDGSIYCTSCGNVFELKAKCEFYKKILNMENENVLEGISASELAELKAIKVERDPWLKTGDVPLE